MMRESYFFSHDRDTYRFSLDLNIQFNSHQLIIMSSHRFKLIKFFQKKIKFLMRVYCMFTLDRKTIFETFQGNFFERDLLASFDFLCLIHNAMSTFTYPTKTSIILHIALNFTKHSTYTL